MGFNISEKTMTEFKVVDMPFIPEHEYFVRMSDFTKKIWIMCFSSLLLFLFSLVF